MGRFFTLIIIFALSSNLTIAQENTIEHSVKNGEDASKISERYGVSLNAIYELNPSLRDTIYIGKILRIPKSNNTIINRSQISNYRVKRRETKYSLSKQFGVSISMLEQQNPHIIKMLQVGHIINIDKTIKEKERPIKNGEYIVKRSDTKFGLAKRFKMTIAELEEKNPHIVNMLMTGHRLNIDNIVTTKNTYENLESEENITVIEESEPTEESESTQGIAFTQLDSTLTAENSTSNDYKYYVIQPKETLSSLSKKAGMSTEAFTVLNPKLLTAVNTGDIIKMPKDTYQTSANTSDTPSSSNQEDVKVINENPDLYSNLEVSTTNGLYFYTPFSDKELSSTELREKLLNNNSNYKKHLDFFQGAQIAIDSALSLNLNFDITLIKTSDIKSNLKIESSYKKNAILIPFLENEASYPEIVSNETISIIDIESNINPIDNSIVYKSIPSENFQKNKTLSYIAGKDAQIIVVSDLEEARNKDLILNTIPEAKFLKVDNAGFFKDDSLQKILSKDQLNYIVLDSKNTIVFLNSTTALMSKLADYNIQLVLIDSSLLPKQNEVSDMRYRILKLIFPTVINKKKNNTITTFENSYEKLFNNKPSRDAILGFDITLDILLRLSQNSSFENTIDTITSEHSHIKFDYKKTDNKNYSNTGVYITQYDANEGVIILD